MQINVFAGKKNPKKTTNSYVIPAFLILRGNILLLSKYTRLKNKISISFLFSGEHRKEAQFIEMFLI